MELYDILKNSLFIMAGPCVIESKDICFEIAERAKNAAEQHGFTYIFKASFDKANRTSATSFRGAGLEKGLQILQEVKSRYKVPVITDIHESYQANPVSDVCDIIQIPAFLCRQTDLLIAAGETSRIVNVKKAQFLSGTDMKYPLEKVRSTGNNQVMVTERGNMYGYGNLVVDFRNLVDMQQLNVPVIMDLTHSTQKPGALDGKSGGNPEYAPYFAAAASACGIRGFFAETHPEPAKALSDGANMVSLNDFPKLLENIKKHSI